MQIVDKGRNSNNNIDNIIESRGYNTKFDVK